MTDISRSHNCTWPACTQSAQEVEELQALCDRLSDILTRTASALKGPPPPLTLHDWSDLPEVAAAVVKRAPAQQEPAGMLHDDGYWTPQELAAAKSRAEEYSDWFLGKPVAQQDPAQRLSDERIVAIAVDHGLCIIVEDAGYKNDALWFDANGITFARAIEAAIVPPGYAVVPMEPTEAMCKAGDDCQDADPRMDDSPSYYTWRAMIAAGDKP